MKKLLLLVGLVALYSFNSFGDEYDDKLKRKYKGLQEEYPNGEEIYCRWDKSEGSVKWDIREVFYIVEKSKKVFFIWKSDEGAGGEKNNRVLLGNDTPDPIVYSSNDKVIWQIGNTFNSYDKKLKRLISDHGDKKNNLNRLNKLKKGMMPDEFWLMDCRIKYTWP